MWSCPICSKTEKNGYKCVNCGFDERDDFANYRTVCLVAEKDVRNRTKCENTSDEIFIMEDPYGTYKGHMKDGKMDGYGTYHSKFGASYEGEFKAGLKEGYGTFYSRNRRICYKGEWKADKREGRGILYFADGGRYEGEFKANMMEGHGVFYYCVGGRYEGEWKAGERDGHGIDYDSSGRVLYEGEWKMGEPEM